MAASPVVASARSPVAAAESGEVSEGGGLGFESEEPIFYKVRAFLDPGCLGGIPRRGGWCVSLGVGGGSVACAVGARARVAAHFLCG
jgi:hypothetical protein